MHSTVTPLTQNAADLSRRLLQNIGKVIRGKEHVIKLSAVALLARGHLLLEDVPGVGKTTLARALAASVGVSFCRLQCTSDLMPSDVVGGNVYDPSTGKFEFHRGPIFTHVLLADEINRSTPKTQSALLEAMEERQVSVDGHTYPLDDPFFVVATQNPLESYGTYPLPESQLDRFLIRVSIGYPSAEVEREVLLSRRGTDPLQNIEPAISAADLKRIQQAVDTVQVDDAVLDYLHAIVMSTRRSPLLEVGVSTRGALGLEKAIRAYALVDGRTYVLPDDVKLLSGPVLAHRVQLTGTHQGAGASRADAERVIRELLGTVPVPV